MEYTQTDEDQFLNGYSQALKLCQYSPDVIEALRSTLNESTPFLEGFCAGIIEYDKIQNRTETRQSELEQLDNNQEQEYDNDIE